MGLETMAAKFDWSDIASWQLWFVTIRSVDHSKIG